MPTMFSVVLARVRAFFRSGDLDREFDHELKTHLAMAEDHKVGVREGRRDSLSMLKDLVSDGSVPQDEGHQTEKKVQSLTDAFVKQIDEMITAKEEEILEV